MQTKAYMNGECFLITLTTSKKVTLRAFVLLALLAIVPANLNTIFALLAPPPEGRVKAHSQERSHTQPPSHSFLKVFCMRNEDEASQLLLPPGEMKKPDPLNTAGAGGPGTAWTPSRWSSW
jgi:hypothetical protein